MAEIFRLEEMSAARWRRLSDSLARGGLLCLPTDTVYGLACLPDLPAAMERLFRVKGREPGKPVARLFADLPQVWLQMPHLTGRVRELMEALLPGPVTAIVSAAGGEDSAGIRLVPPAFREAYGGLPLPLALTSANLAGGPDPLSLDDVPGAVTSSCDYCVDGGASPAGSPSTVVDLRPAAAGGAPVILREGALPQAEVERLTGIRVKPGPGSS